MSHEIRFRLKSDDIPFILALGTLSAVVAFIFSTSWVHAPVLVTLFFLPFPLLLFLAFETTFDTLQVELAWFGLGLLMGLVVLGMFSVGVIYLLALILAAPWVVKSTNDKLGYRCSPIELAALTSGPVIVFGSFFLIR